MKGGDRASNPAPASDFNRKDQPATSMGSLCERCGGGLHYGSRFCSYRCYAEFRRGLPLKKVPVPICVHCGEPRSPRAKAFCSYACRDEWQRENPPERPDPPSRAEMVDQMHAALDQLQALVLSGEDTP